jgi:hypothetical protein
MSATAKGPSNPVLSSALSSPDHCKRALPHSSSLVKSISGGGTAELNYQHATTVVGPQLSFDKNHLVMMTPVGITKQDSGTLIVQ